MQDRNSELTLDQLPKTGLLRLGRLGDSLVKPKRTREHHPDPFGRRSVRFHLRWAGFLLRLIASDRSLSDPDRRTIAAWIVDDLATAEAPTT